MSTEMPMRQCMVCRIRCPQGTLIRVARTSEGLIEIDRGRHRAAGRGAYVCLQARCLQRAPQTARRVLHAALADEFSTTLQCVAEARAAHIRDCPPAGSLGGVEHFEED